MTVLGIKGSAEMEMASSLAPSIPLHHACKMGDHLIFRTFSFVDIKMGGIQLSGALFISFSPRWFFFS